MELIVIIRMLCISLSLLLTPCVSLLNDQLQSSHDLGHDQQLTLPTLPRKLKLNQVPNVKEDGALKGLTKQMEVLSGKNKIQTSNAISKVYSGTFYGTEGVNTSNGLTGKWQQKGAQVMHGVAATRQEWIKRSESGDTTSQFFTMDYSPVRRRRPIHNKSLPVAP